ncbi:hypothetical protein [Paracoccus thiocyanatus]|uniref:hypothetical protein n=1 Tax=Paracoccus thiocyanatus TaxID=34006 RepID=UPI001CB6E4E5|nr:hypothetical protein [Paracoccus thiocyanatus]
MAPNIWSARAATPEKAAPNSALPLSVMAYCRRRRSLLRISRVIRRFASSRVAARLTYTLSSEVR